MHAKFPIVKNCVLLRPGEDTQIGSPNKKAELNNEFRFVYAVLPVLA